MNIVNNHNLASNSEQRNIPYHYTHKKLAITTAWLVVLNGGNENDNDPFHYSVKFYQKFHVIPMVISFDHKKVFCLQIFITT